MSTRDDGETVRGVRPAIVRDNEDPESLGRVRVAYPWAETDEAFWARVATEMTGDRYGTYFLPEKDDEVLVAFEDGDLQSPYVVGSLWTPSRPPPEDNGGDNDVKAIETRSGHRIEFDDDADDGAAAVTLETAGGHEITLDDETGSESITIEDSAGNAVELDATSGEISLSATDTIRLEASTIELDAENAVDIEATREVSVDSNTTVSITSSGQLQIETSGLGKLESAGPLQLKGAIIQLN